MLERAIVAKAMQTAKALGWKAIKIHGNQYQEAGLPDILVIKDGRAAWMEAKQPGQDPTKLQAHKMRELSAYGCPVTVIYSAADARHFLESIDQ